MNVGKKKITVTTGRYDVKVTPEELNKIVKCLEPIKDEFDFEFDINVKF